ncbi:hypothetical protein GXW78_13105 [Roseomonas terrae]|jgi:hypothetical protein|uniref:Hedgehog/Intein (Hint) domain-containing protein n=1 Tax=Neoroseomonas terrae TaxID=424799 RepID=A0ABS5EJ16_9PROT|nr:Hint domain-containing protein [Neoroseomonas terrae]MBR0650607.1 hypothetical protein [Neoroseomonas terrae]
MAGTTLTGGNAVWPNGAGNWGNDTIHGGDEANWIDGGGGDDYLHGGGGNDTLIGGGGTDHLFGGSGDDSLTTGGWGAATLDGGEGNDTLVAIGGDALLLGGGGHDSLVGSGTGYAETLDGGDGNDWLHAGNGGPRVLLGGAGDDTFSGFTRDGQIKFVDGGSGRDVALIDNFDPDKLLNASGTVSVGGQTYHYNRTYITADGYNIYFGSGYGGTIVCFAEGTMIMTPQGERAIETLRAGDLVVTASGRGAPFKPVRWVGRRTVDLAAHPEPEKAAPVLVMPGALGDNAPWRPLRVSPDHALLVDGALVPAKLLVDGEAILSLPPRGRITYFHVELDEHDILLADGAPSESYIDLGNRDAFENAGVVQMLHPDFAPRRDDGMPRVTDGPALTQARLTVARRRERTAIRAAG